MITDLLFQGDHTVKGILVITLIVSILIFAYALEKIGESVKRDRRK